MRFVFYHFVFFLDNFGFSNSDFLGLSRTFAIGVLNDLCIPCCLLLLDVGAHLFDSNSVSCGHSYRRPVICHRREHCVYLESRSWSTFQFQ